MIRRWWRRGGCQANPEGRKHNWSFVLKTPTEHVSICWACGEVRKEWQVPDVEPW